MTSSVEREQQKEKQSSNETHRIVLCMQAPSAAHCASAAKELAEHLLAFVQEQFGPLRSAMVKKVEHGVLMVFVLPFEKKENAQAMMKHYRNNHAFWNGGNNKSKKQNYWCGFKTVTMEHSQPVSSIWVCRVAFEEENVVDRRLVEAFESFAEEEGGENGKNNNDDDDDEPEPCCNIELKHGGSLFIHYKTPKQAENAVAAMHGFQVDERARKLIVDYALDQRKSLLPPSVAIRNGHIVVANNAASAVAAPSLPAVAASAARAGIKNENNSAANASPASMAPSVLNSAPPAMSVSPAVSPAASRLPAPAQNLIDVSPTLPVAAAPAVAPAVAPAAPAVAVLPAVATTKTLAALSSAAVALAAAGSAAPAAEPKMLTIQSSMADVVAWIKAQKFPLKTEKTLVEKFQAHHINGSALLEAESVDELLKLTSVALLAGPLLNLRRAWKVQKQAASEH